ncbi:LAQU0S12e00474g1_1 [Lachancea quebecensis]|uniref:LAQU0S12e00474g1_1 n=1 Tax=Lachancea quebecensis TaxID=1654605 RepID=A0A0P1KUI4_9SACH|nr:LAQU0S12e00474g1_1 [Lachancea quebecensis]
MEDKQEPPKSQSPLVSEPADIKKFKSEDFPSQNEDEEPFYDFQAFVKLMKDPRADPIVRYTRSFLNNFLTKREFWTSEEQRKLVNDFKIFVFDKLPFYEPFKSADAANLLNAKEGMEKLIMGKLYHKCFSPCLKSQSNLIDKGHKTDLNQDAMLEEKREEFRFIDPEHLEINDKISSKLETFARLSAKELGRMNDYKAPRDKMVCALNACRVIFGFLKHLKLERDGADAFIPLLVYAILKSDVESLISNVNYIERFRYPDFLRGESSYYLSSLQGAANFVANMQMESLHVEDKQDFESKYHANQNALKKERYSRQPIDPHKNASIPREPYGPSPSDYILKPLDGATNIVLSKFAELFSPTSTSPEDYDGHQNLEGHNDITRLAQEMEEKEHARVLRELHDMFPDMDQELIGDVSIAKKYRIGACVDVLLTLSS